MLRGNLREMEGTRAIKRADRQRHRVPSVAIVGYTNAGKSSLLNRLTHAGVLVEEALCATLDPTTRRTTTADGRVYTLTYTVGFVRHLPTDLVEAFRSTLEETVDADLLVHVVDGSDADPLGQIDAVRTVLAEIGASDRPEQLVINKIDQADPDVLAVVMRRYPEAIAVSARTGEGIETLRETIERRLPVPQTEITALVPWDRGDLVDRVHREADVFSLEHEPGGTLITARVHPDLAAQLNPYAQANRQPQ